MPIIPPLAAAGRRWPTIEHMSAIGARCTSCVPQGLRLLSWGAAPRRGISLG
jgi:hypothetical protein